MYKPPKRHYEYQVGWTGPPRAFDAVLNDFLRLSPSTLGIIQRVLHIPHFGYSVKERAKNFHLIEEAVQCLAECGADVVAQSGCNWVHCAGHRLNDIRGYKARLEDAHGVQFHMEGLSLIEAMHELGAERIAVNAGYNNRAWLDGYLKFLSDASLEVTYAANFVEQGLYDSEEQMASEAFIFPVSLASRSVERVLSAAPEVDAVLFMGMPSWETSDHHTIRTHDFVEQLELDFGIPVVCGGIAMYWAIYQSLSIAPEGIKGQLLRSLSAYSS